MVIQWQLLVTVLFTSLSIFSTIMYAQIWLRINCDQKLDHGGISVVQVFWVEARKEMIISSGIVNFDSLSGNYSLEMVNYDCLRNRNLRLSFFVRWNRKYHWSGKIVLAEKKWFYQGKIKNRFSMSAFFLSKFSRCVAPHSNDFTQYR